MTNQGADMSNEELVKQLRNCLDADQDAPYVRIAHSTARGLLAALTAHLTAAQGDGWMLIETAPRDGRKILLGRWNSFGKWRTMLGRWFSQETISEEWENDDCDEGWYETSVENDELPNCWPTEPTHWQPLPALPTNDKES